MYKSTIKHTKDFVFTASSEGGTFVIDAKGKEGITPPDTLLASLGSCIGVYIRKYAEGAKLALEDFSLSLEAELSKEAPVSFRLIRVSVDLSASGLDERRIKALAEFIKNCPVHNTLHGNPQVEIELL